MRPPHLRDTAIQELIRELKVGDALPAGAVVRRELIRRFGRPGGVERIYRLLAAEQLRDIPAPEPGGVEALQQALQGMRARAERAEERERAHQTQWLMEIDRLRMRLQVLEPLAMQANRDAAEVLLRQQLRAAEQRAARLEEELMQLRR